MAHCRDVTREHSKTFYLGSRLFPLRQRQAVWAVYAACRDGDDIVDESTGDDAAAELDGWWARDAGRLCWAPARRPAHPVDTALAWAAQTYPIPLSAFAELHEGLRMDLNDHVYHDMDDLTLYCRRVAGVIGFMIAPDQRLQRRREAPCITR